MLNMNIKNIKTNYFYKVLRPSKNEAEVQVRAWFEVAIPFEHEFIYIVCEWSEF